MKNEGGDDFDTKLTELRRQLGDTLLAIHKLHRERRAQAQPVDPHAWVIATGLMLADCMFHALTALEENDSSKWLRHVVDAALDAAKDMRKHVVDSERDRWKASS